MTERPAPAKLELLVRRDDESFEVREVGSALGFIQSRPQRGAEGSFEVSEVRSSVAAERSFILKSAATERFLVLSEPEKFLWEQMDGNTSLQEIATAYVLRYGEFDFDIIPNLIRKLQRARLLTLEPKSRLRQALARNRGQRVAKAVEATLMGLERINLSSRRVQPLFQRLHRWGGFVLFTRAAVVAAQAPVGSFTQAFAAASGIIQWQALAISLYPFCFIEMDGYHVFVDLLGVPTLKHDAVSYVKALLRGRERLRWGRLEALWLAYVGLSSLSIAAFLAFNVWIVVSAVS